MSPGLLLVASVPPVGMFSASACVCACGGRDVPRLTPEIARPRAAPVLHTQCGLRSLALSPDALRGLYPRARIRSGPCTVCAVGQPLPFAFRDLPLPVARSFSAFRAVVLNNGLLSGFAESSLVVASALPRARLLWLEWPRCAAHKSGMRRRVCFLDSQVTSRSDVPLRGTSPHS